MKQPKPQVRINACKIEEYNDATFTALYMNPGVEWFGETHDLEKLARRAKRLNLSKEKVK